MVAVDSTNARLREKLESGAKQFSIELNELQLDHLISYLSLLSKWNRVYNLTAVRKIEDMVGRHILDSLSVLQWMPVKSVDDADYDVLDVGTGAGLPVIPLAIMRPDLNFLSVESNGKKTRFQHQALLELGLTNVSVEHARVEDVGSSASTIVSRAFTAPEKFLSAVQKNCLNGSRIIIMLGLKELMPDELASGFKLEELQLLDVPECESTRHVALVNYIETE